MTFGIGLLTFGVLLAVLLYGRSPASSS